MVSEDVKPNVLLTPTPKILQLPEVTPLRLWQSGGEKRGQMLPALRRRDALRRKAWPEDPSLRDKLEGSLTALRRKAALVRATGVTN